MNKMRLLKFIAVVFWLSVQRQITFRANFLFQFCLTGFSVAAGVVAILPLFDYTTSVGGWTLPGVLMLLGTFQLVTGLLWTFIEPNLSFFQEKVTKGEVDDLLIRPVPSLFFASFNSCNPWGLFQVVIGVVVTLVGVHQLHGHFAVAAVFVYVLQVFMGVCIAWAYRVIMASLSFWAPGTEPSVIYNAFWQFGRYPVTVYSRSIRWLLSFVVPVAFVAMLPTQTLVKGIQPAVLLETVLLTCLSLAAAYLIWNQGLRRYTSATS